VLKLPLRVELVLADQGHGVNHEAESLLVDPVRRIDGGKQLGGEPSGLHPHGQVNLLGGGKQGDSADVLQVHPNWIVGGCVVPAPRDLSAFLSLLFGLLPRDLEDLDALLAKVLLHVHEEALDLFAAELVHGKPLEKVLGGNEAALLPPRRDGLQSRLVSFPFLDPLQSDHLGRGPVAFKSKPGRTARRGSSRIHRGALPSDSPSQQDPSPRA
jgi:hypothetical protein